MNLATVTKTPLGFAFFYALSANPELVQVNDKFATHTGLNISYTGAPHFNLGLQVSRLKVPIPGVEDKVKSGTIIISSKYYFN